MELTSARRATWQFWVIGLTLLTGLILSTVSYLDLCTEECKAGHDWTLFGLPFGPIGIVAFAILLGLHLYSLVKPEFHFYVALAVAAALGGEIVLIWIQKYQIGHWCPVCLGIAASIATAAAVYAYNYYQELKKTNAQKQKGAFMKSLWKGILALTVFFMGFLTFYIGIAKENKLEAMQDSVKDQIAFGDLNSPVSVYLFTDWACPACRALEPKLEKILPVILSKARMTFVDIPVHPETLNYAPFNLSFMINNKDKYLKLRDALTELSVKTGTPTDVQIAKIAKDNGATFKELNYADVALGLKYGKELAAQFDIEATPTLVIVNAKAKKGKKLSGLEEITEANVLKAIDTLK